MSRWIRQITWALTICAVGTFLTGFIYAGFNWPMLVTVWITAGLWYINFAVLGFLIACVVSILSFEKLPKIAFFALHLVAAVVVSAILTALAFLDLKIYANPNIERYLYAMYPQYFNIGLIVYAAIAGWMYMLQYQRRAKEQAIREVDLERLAREAELRALKAQINPHFLFNALNSVNALVIRDPEGAREMNTRLGNILRYALDSSERQFVALREELAFIDDYLRIEKLRLGDRLDVTRDIDDSLLNAMIPPMALEPIVENAIKHGIANRKEGGTISIHVTLGQGKLRCTVSDTGSGIECGDKESILERGIGLRNTLERLKRLYDDSFTFSIENRTPSGCTVAIAIPFKDDAS